MGEGDYCASSAVIAKNRMNKNNHRQYSEGVREEIHEAFTN